MQSLQNVTLACVFARSLTIQSFGERAHPAMSSYALLRLVRWCADTRMPFVRLPHRASDRMHHTKVALQTNTKTASRELSCTGTQGRRRARKLSSRVNRSFSFSNKCPRSLAERIKAEITKKQVASLYLAVLTCASESCFASVR
jgi:hypothetical protein